MSKQKVTLRIEEGEVELLKEKFKTDNQSEAIRLAILQSVVTEDLEKVKTLFPYVGKKPPRIGREVVNVFEQSGCEIFVDLFGGSIAMLCYLPWDVKVVVNDINGNLTNLYMVIRDKPKEFVSKVMKLPYSEVVFQKCKEDTVQASRDLLKNHIMELYEIPLLRFMTNGSGEKEKIIPKLTVADLKQDAIQLFKDKAVKRGRLTKEEASVEDTILMDNLHLIDEDGYLIRAAMLAFYKDPEKWVTGSYIKIGYFGKSDSDLVYQDEVHGLLIEQVDKTVDLVYTKYMKALIDYEGVQRIEQFMFHKDACREILLNAIVHKDYSSCNPIQISVYENKIYIWNDGEMPPNLDSTDKLFMKHSSKPFNPKLANVFFKSGMIEAWGRGFEKIREPQTASEIMQKFNLERSYFRRHYLNKMLKTGELQRTEPDKPKSKNQKYYS